MEDNNIKVGDKIKVDNEITTVDEIVIEDEVPFYGVTKYGFTRWVKDGQFERV